MMDFDTSMCGTPGGGIQKLIITDELITRDVIDDEGASLRIDYSNGCKWYEDQYGNRYATYEELLSERREQKINELLNTPDKK